MHAIKAKPRKPTVPRPAVETVRQAIVALLRQQERSALEISGQVHIPEKEVYAHLEHIRQSLQAGGELLEVIPAECRSCGFIFAKRERLAAPGRCPVCRHEAVFEPLFVIRQAHKRVPSKEEKREISGD